MEFISSLFPKRKGKIEVTEKFVKIDIPDAGMFSGGDVVENIPIQNISNVKISRRTNFFLYVFGLIFFLGGAIFSVLFLLMIIIRFL
ncbi:hypothetical protein IW492_02115 [Enterococcus sp. BWB1-3]|uniref:hypothetical protein n=1 Tax=Enterococcus sp. BWB1-3 TaxID=2787713 RepID=UPI001921F26B|nr:hypothetical protein [Enterococcus sp. BWB1-3]MBL1228025.1 hypothetical protein [Enterococcus sp. BWB1-3]